jgi:hypothetical protein
MTTSIVTPAKATSRRTEPLKPKTAASLFIASLFMGYLQSLVSQLIEAEPECACNPSNGEEARVWRRLLFDASHRLHRKSGTPGYVFSRDARWCIAACPQQGGKTLASLAIVVRVRSSWDK